MNVHILLCLHIFSHQGSAEYLDLMLSASRASKYRIITSAGGTETPPWTLPTTRPEGDALSPGLTTPLLTYLVNDIDFSQVCGSLRWAD